MGGAPSALKRWCDRSVIIKPGNETNIETVKQIAEVLDTTTDKVQKVLPPGGINIESVIEKTEQKEEQDS
jgi:hypothetical protein